MNRKAEISNPHGPLLSFFVYFSRINLVIVRVQLGILYLFRSTSVQVIVTVVILIALVADDQAQAGIVN